MIWLRYLITHQINTIGLKYLQFLNPQVCLTDLAKSYQGL